MAAGSGTRMGGQMPKQFLEIDGKAILQKTIEVFLESCPGIRVITVLPETFMDYWKEYCYKRRHHTFPLSQECLGESSGRCCRCCT